MKFPNWLERVKSARPAITMALAASMQTNRAMLFDESGSYNGHKAWKPLAFRKGKPLLDRGTLRKSMGPSNDGVRPGSGPNSILQVSGNVAKIGTKIAYASILNSGGRIVAKNAKALMIPIPQGSNLNDKAKKSLKGKMSRVEYAVDGKIKKKNVIFRKSVKIPARNFDSLTNQDREEFRDTITNMVAKVMNGR